MNVERRLVDGRVSAVNQVAVIRESRARLAGEKRMERAKLVLGAAVFAGMMGVCTVGYYALAALQGKGH